MELRAISHREAESYIVGWLSGRSLADISAITENPSHPIHWMKRIHTVWFRSYTASYKYGFRGVGQIAFADERVIHYQKRVYQLAARHHSTPSTK